MPLTHFARCLTRFFVERQSSDRSFSMAKLAQLVGRNRSTVKRWLDGEVSPSNGTQIEVLCKLGILEGGKELDFRDARVEGRICLTTGSVQMVAQPLEDSIPVQYLEVFLNRDPLWSLTVGDPFLLRLDGSLPGYEMMDNKAAARKPRPSSLLEVPVGTMAIARLLKEKDPSNPLDAEWDHAFVYINRISDSYPFLQYTRHGTGVGYYVFRQDAFEILALVFPYESSTTAE